MTLEEQMETLRKAQQLYERDSRYLGEGAMEGNCYTPVEKKDEYASKGVAGTALGFGIGAAALNLLQQGGLGGLFGGGCGCGRPQFVTRDEAELQSKLNAKDSEIALLKADKYTDQKIVETYNALYGKIESLGERLTNRIEAQRAAQDAVNLQQATLNAAQTSTIGCLKQQIDQLFGLTKLVVSNGSVCPGWGNVTITPATTTTTTPAA